MTTRTTIPLIIFIFIGIVSEGLSGNEDTDMEEVLFRCCNAGLNAAVNRNCSSLSLEPIQQVSEEYQTVCSSTLELCCARKLRELECEEGKAAAQNGDRCSRTEMPDDQYCCEACKLGLLTGAKGSNCNLGRVNVGTLWGTAYQSCCRNVQQYPPATDNENMCDVLPGELCAHYCHAVSGSYKCSCRPGFVLLPDGKSCEEDLSDKCQTNENRCSQLCQHTARGITCSCHSGYKLANDNITCIRITDPKNRRCEIGYSYNFTTRICSDINECIEENPCDQTIEDCFNTEGSYRCGPKRNCDNGYRFSSKRNTCIDIDECEEQFPCDSTQVCSNTDGGYECSCRPGYQQDLMTLGCLDVNECQTNQAQCRTGERCDNTIGSYLCVRYANCGTGYTLNAATGKCEDNDECAMGTHDCDLAGPDRVCLNIQGSFRCVRKGVQNIYCTHKNCNVTRPQQYPRQCRQGFVWENGECTDINECAKGTYFCNHNEVCVNIPGYYRCSKVVNCQPGFKLTPDRRECIDIDECNEQKGLCSHSCINLYGTYTCGCNPGFKLDVDNRTCVDVNECDISHRLCAGFCVNELGSYSCQCPEGYRLSSDRISCDDIDECRSPETCQDPKEMCLNMRGTYRCTQVNCPSGYERDPSRRNRCRRINNVCSENDLECRKQPLSYTTNYITITSNMTIPSSGLDIFNLKGPLFSSTSVRFKMDVAEALAAPQVRAATRDYFRMRMSGHNQVTISILKSIEGPQDVVIKLGMDFYNNGIYGGTTISNLEIFVSQYPF